MKKTHISINISSPKRGSAQNSFQSLKQEIQKDVKK